MSYTQSDLNILKTLISNKALAFEFVSTYGDELFSDYVKPIAKLILSYIKGYNTLPTKRVLIDIADKDGYGSYNIEDLWEEIEGTDYNVDDFKYDIDQLKIKLAGEKLEKIKNIIEDSSSNDLNTVLKSLEAEINSTRKLYNGKKQNYINKPVSDYVHEFRDEFAAKLQNPGLRKGILTGYSYLDYVTNGLNPAELLIVSAETSAGKSQMLNNMAIQMWMQENTLSTPPEEFLKGYNVLYFSLEMPYGPCFNRTISRVADVPAYGIRDCSLNPPQLNSLKSALKFMKRYPYDFSIVDLPRGTTAAEVESIFNETCNKKKPDIVVVDYMGIMEEKSDGDDWLKLGNIAGKLHEIARTYNVVMLTAVQLNRLGNRGKNPEQHDIIGLHRMGRSSLIAHHANIVIQIETRKDEKTYADLKYHIIKCRDGELGSHVLRKNFANSSITELEKYEPATVTTDGFSSISVGGDDLSEHLKNIGWFDE